MTTEVKPPVCWGILSTANIATKVAHAIHLAENADLVAVASRTEERAATWAEEHNVSISYGTYDALLADDSLDAIYIPLPPSLHAEWTIKAAEHVNMSFVKNRLLRMLPKRSLWQTRVDKTVCN